MNDERLFERLAAHAGPAEVDPGFEDRLYALLQVEMRRPEQRTARPALLLVAALVAILVISAAVAVGSGLIELPWVDGSPTPNPSSAASAEPSPTPFEPSPTPTSPVPASSWTATGSMAAPRTGHTATLLPDGRVLVAGGNELASAELYDPASGRWIATGSMAAARSGHTATLLPDGRVLVAGGNTLARAELYDPSTGFWTATGNMVVPRSGHTATRLSDGTVLVAGGYFGSIAPSSFALPSAELYDPSNGTWTEIGNLTEARAEHTATRLPDGTVLVAGGMTSGTGPVLASTELYDPSTRAWTASRNMDGVRQGHAATLLSDGTVLVVGGFADTGSSSGRLASAVLYDPSTETWTATGSMAAGRADPIAIQLSNGTVLIVGGYDSAVFPRSPVASPDELYDPSSGTWTGAGRMIEDRTFHTATLLPDGRVLVAGGVGSGAPVGPILASAELYDPGSGT